MTSRSICASCIPCAVRATGLRENDQFCWFYLTSFLASFPGRLVVKKRSSPPEAAWERGSVVTPACKLPVFLLHYVIAEKGVGHAIDGEEGRTVCRSIVQG